MKIAFIGLGNMGAPMAANLAKAGATLAVKADARWDAGLVRFIEVVRVTASSPRLCEVRGDACRARRRRGGHEERAGARESPQRHHVLPQLGA